RAHGAGCTTGRGHPPRPSARRPPNRRWTWRGPVGGGSDGVCDAQTAFQRRAARRADVRARFDRTGCRCHAGLPVAGPTRHTGRSGHSTSFRIVSCFTKNPRPPTRVNDSRLALRHLLKCPGCTGIAAIALALGIGLRTSMLSLMNLLILKPLPYAESDQRMRIYRTNPQDSSAQHSASDYMDLV